MAARIRRRMRVPKPHPLQRGRSARGARRVGVLSGGATLHRHRPRLRATTPPSGEWEEKIPIVWRTLQRNPHGRPRERMACMIGPHARASELCTFTDIAVRRRNVAQYMAHVAMLYNCTDFIDLTAIARHEALRNNENIGSEPTASTRINFKCSEDARAYDDAFGESTSCKSLTGLSDHGCAS